MKKTTLTLTLIALCLVGCIDRSQTSERSQVTAEDLAKALNLEFCEIIVPDAVREALQNNEARLYLLKERSNGYWDFATVMFCSLEEGENIRFFGNRFNQKLSFITNDRHYTFYVGREDLKYASFPQGRIDLENFIFGFINYSLYSSPPRLWVGDTIPEWFEKKGVPPGSRMKWNKYRIVVSNAIPDEVPEYMKRNILILDSRAGIEHDAHENRGPGKQSEPGN